jgi:hypothetical protein
LGGAASGGNATSTMTNSYHERHRFGAIDEVLSDFDLADWWT